ncbi:MAG: PqiC family protein [Proteobacteria bacterium]|nr:PqiC family protein [Pseudomonadota bacterium]
MKSHHTAAGALALALLAGCAGPERPVRAMLYDFGPGATQVQPATRMAPLPAIALADIDAGGALDSSAMLYRLGYADANQLRPYAQARWTAAPAQLVRQRLREHLSQRRVVLNTGEGAALLRSGGVAPRVLRLELEEFSHMFESPTQSAGVIRLRATLAENTPSGERLLAQRAVIVQRPAPTADAPGGVRALAAATDAAAEELSQWLQQVP